jgi:hypothetical protein
MVTRIIACLLMGAVAALAGVRPVAAVEAPDSIVGLDATYDASATIAWKKGRVTVTSIATVTNNSDSAVGALTFNAAPARIGRMQLLGVDIGPDPALAEVQDQSIIVTLPAPLEPTQQVAVKISYWAWFGGRSGNKQWLFAKVNGIATAYRWIPWLSRAYPFITPTYGEPFVTKVSTEVRVTIVTDKPMQIATSGQQTGGDALSRTYVADNVRDFNFAASPKYARRTATWGDVSIDFFYIQLPIDKIQQLTLASLDRFSQRVGSYPYPTLTVAEVPTGPSMESPAMVWISQRGIARGTVNYLTVHELAHQWFYGIVGNDQAVEPFADEAMAEFLTRDFIGHRASHCAESVLDMRVFDYSAACYYEVIYVQGDNYLDAYRLRVGDAAFWDGMRRYFEAYKFRFGGTRELLQALDEAAGPAGGGHSGRFPHLYPGAGG